MKKLLVLLFFTIMTIASAKELYNAQFSTNKAAIDDWNIAMLGDESCQLIEFERVDSPENAPAVLQATTQRSWGAFVKDFTAEELEGIKTLYISCDVMTNIPKRAEIAISENSTWGGASTHFTLVHVNEAYKWERVTIKLDRIHDHSFVSFGVSLSYNDSTGWMAVDNVVITADEPPAERPMPDYSIQIPKNRNLATMLQNCIRKVNSLKTEDAATDIETLEKAYIEIRADEDTISSVVLSDAVNTISKYKDIHLFVEPVANTTVYTQNTAINNDLSVQSMNLPQNAKDSLLYLVRNNSEVAQNVRVSVTEKASEYAKFYQLIEVDDYPNYPKELSNNEFINIGSGETTGIMIEFDTKNVKAGVYDGLLSLSSFNSRAADVNVPFKLNVGEYVLPNELPIKSFHWDYNVAALDQEKLDYMINDRINTYHVSMRGGIDSLDMSMVERVASNLKKSAPDMEFYIIVEVWFPRETAVWTPEYSEWLDQVAKILADNGIPKSNWFLEIYDEEMPPEFLHAAKEIKKHDPELRIFSDYLPKTTQVREDFLPYLDVWCPVAYDMPPVNNEFTEFCDRMIEYKSENENIDFWTYRCNPNAFAPSIEFRQMGLQAIVNQLEGLGFWTVYTLGTRGSEDSGYNWGFFYKTPEGKLIRARHWMQYASCLEDYMLFSAALEQGGEVADIAQEAVDKLKKASADRNDNYGDIVNHYRGLLINKM